MAFSARFAEALVLAAGLHRDQVRKNRPAPYLSHLLSVTAIVMEYGGCEDEVIAALLHDAVEDQGGAATAEMIRRLFGEEIAAIVEGCSDTDQSPKPPWRQRKERYIDHLARASHSVLLICAADKLANARSLLVEFRQCGDAVWERFTATREELFWFYRSVARTLRSAHVNVYLVEELESVIEQLDRLTAQISVP